MVIAKDSKNSRYTNKSYAVYGNYALDTEKYESYERVKHDVSKSIRNDYKRKLRKQFRLIALVAIMFSLGIVVVGRYALIMSLSNESRIVEKNIAASLKENDELKLQLMEYNDIKAIEKAATEELGMVQPSTSNMVHISAAVVGSNTESGKDKDKKVSILDKFISFFN